MKHTDRFLNCNAENNALWCFLQVYLELQVVLVFQEVLVDLVGQGSGFLKSTH